VAEGYTYQQLPGPNLRFVSAKDVIWDEQAWRDWANHAEMYEDLNIEAVLKQVKTWTEEGF
jgi:hypothetical protein